MLSTEELRKRCSQAGLDNQGNRLALIECLAEQCEDSHNSDPTESIPKDLHRLTDEQLADVCAAHHLHGLSSRMEKLEALEELRLEGKPTSVRASIKAPAKVLEIKDKKYLRKQGQKVGAGEAKKATNPPKAKAKAKAAGKAAVKRRRVDDD